MKILKFYYPLPIVYIELPTHGILTPLPMEYCPPPPTYGISNPLLWYYELLSFGRNEGGGFKLPWGGSKYNDKKLTMGFKIPYDTGLGHVIFLLIYFWFGSHIVEDFEVP